MKTLKFFVIFTACSMLMSGICANEEEEISKIVTPTGGVHPTKDNQDLVKKFYEYVEKNEIRELTKMLSNNFQLVDASAAYDSDYSKYDAMSKSMTVRVKALHKSLPNFSMNVLELIGDGNKVVARSMITGIQKGEFLGISATHKPVAIKTFAIFTIQDGKILNISEMWNELSVMKQIGYIIL